MATNPSPLSSSKSVGLFIAADKKDAPIVKDFATGTTLVRLWASHFGGLVPLTKSEQNFVKRWYLATPDRPNQKKTRYN